MAFNQWQQGAEPRCELSSIQKADRFRSAPYLAAKVPILQFSIPAYRGFQSIEAGRRTSRRKAIESNRAGFVRRFARETNRHIICL
jgi:hypothetical protein